MARQPRPLKPAKAGRWVMIVRCGGWAVRRHTALYHTEYLAISLERLEMAALEVTARGEHDVDREQ